MTNEEILKLNGGKKFDIVLMNPPYARDLHIDFLQKAVDVCNKIVVIEPGQWLTQLKENGKYTKEESATIKLKNQIKGHVKSVELNNYNKELNIANKTVCSITSIDMTRKYDEIELENVTENKTVKTLEDCNLIGNIELIKSVFNKCKLYGDCMGDHCINVKKYVDYENKDYWFLPYGNYMINSLGSNYGANVEMFYRDSFKTHTVSTTTKFGEYYNCYTTVLCTDKKEQLTHNLVPKGVKHGSPRDCLFGTKKELENWQYNTHNTKLPLFISICLTIDENNNCKSYVPWLVDKQYTDEEIYKLLNINEEEQKLIDETLIKFERSSDWCKQYMLGKQNKTTNE